jgi:hypothetical protein
VRKTTPAAPVAKKQLTPTLVDKKAVMDDRQKAACVLVEVKTDTPCPVCN